jgi:hypothetical protein
MSKNLELHKIEKQKSRKLEKDLLRIEEEGEDDDEHREEKNASPKHSVDGS